MAIRALPIWERLVPEKGVVPLSMRVAVLEERSKPRKPTWMPLGGLAWVWRRNQSEKEITGLEKKEIGALKKQLERKY